MQNADVHEEINMWFCGFRFLAKGLKHTSQSYWNGMVGWSRVTATEEFAATGKTLH
jgi:hypothetical protein